LCNKKPHSRYKPLNGQTPDEPEDDSDEYGAEPEDNDEAPPWQEEDDE